MMKVQIDKSGGRSSFEFGLLRDRTDPVLPVEKLTFATRLRHLNPDRFAVALSFMLARLVSSEMKFEEAISPNVQYALQRFFAPRHVVCGPSEHTPRAIPIGSRTLEVGAASGDRSARAVDVQFEIANSQSFTSFLSVERVSVASNIHALDALRLGQRNNLIELGAAVLFAEDLDVAKVVVPHCILYSPHLSRIQDALRAVNILLDTEIGV